MRRIVSSTLKLSEHERCHYTVKAEVGTTKEDLLAPEYFASIAERLKPGDVVCVIPDDYSWEAVLFVRASQKNLARVVIREFYNYDEAEGSLELPDNYTVEWSGPTKWRIKRISDNAIIEKGFPDKVSAIKKIQFIVNGGKVAA